jgi:hypothetical protein
MYWTDDLLICYWMGKIERKNIGDHISFIHANLLWSALSSMSISIRLGGRGVGCGHLHHQNREQLSRGQLEVFMGATFLRSHPG